MVRRILRLVRAELLKLMAQRFITVAVVMVAATVLLAIHFQRADVKPESYAAPSAFQFFADGYKYGQFIALLFIVIFSSLLFSSEFDKGTMKNLLTRPVSRTDVFAAKCTTAILVAIFLLVVTFYASALYSILRGEIGPIWEDGNYFIKMHLTGIMQGDRYYAGLTERLVEAFLLSLPSFLAAIALGILISSMMENSGYAVAMTLSVILLLYFLSGFSLFQNSAHYLFVYYPEAAFSAFQSAAKGSSVIYATTEAEKNIAQNFLRVPFLTAGVFLLVAYTRFRFKNIHG